MMIGTCSRFLVSLAVVALLMRRALADPPPANAPPATPAAASSQHADDFVIGNVGFIVFHEFGHAVIREFHVPLLGLEEDSADTIAAITMLELDKTPPPEKKPLAELLTMAALGNMLTWQAGLEKSNAEVAVWAQHSLSIKRFARVTCLIYGSDAARFQWVADAAKMPDIRADWCEDEYNVARQGVDWLIKNYGAGEHKAHGRISVKYENPRTPAQKEARAFLEQSRVLEKVAAFVDTRFDFAKPFEVRVKPCASPNAYWDPDARELLFCYDMVEALRKMSDKPVISEVGRAFDARQP